MVNAVKIVNEFFFGLKKLEKCYSWKVRKNLSGVRVQKNEKLNPLRYAGFCVL